MRDESGAALGPVPARKRGLRESVVSLSLLAVIGCGEGSRDVGGSPGPVTDTLQATRVGRAPTGPSDPIWRGLPRREVPLTNVSTGLLYGDGDLNQTDTYRGLESFNGGASAGLELQAAYHQHDVYILARWIDGHADLERRSALFDGPLDPHKPAESTAGFTSQRNDDKIAFAWAIGDPSTVTSNVAGAGESFATRGCQAACHDLGSGREMRPATGSVDLWDWKAAGSAPLGFASDQVADGPGGRRGDSDLGFEQRNVPTGGDARSGPRFLWDGSEQVIGEGPRENAVLDPAFFLLNGHTVDVVAAGWDAGRGDANYSASCASCHGATGEGGSAPSLGTNGVARKSDAELRGTISVASHPGAPAWNDLSPASRNDLVMRVRGIRGTPGQVLNQPDGSQADIVAIDDRDLSLVDDTAQDAYVVMMTRRLTTENPDDVSFDPGARRDHPFGVALMDRDGKNHVGSALETLEFLP